MTFKICKQCGNKFPCKPSHMSRRTYCSKACMAKGYKKQLTGANNPHYKGGDVTKQCNFCGKDYTVPHAWAKTRKNCSLSCAAQYGRSLQVVKPHFGKVCGHPSRRGRSYCVPCLDARKEMRRCKCKSCGENAFNGSRYCGACRDIVMVKKTFEKPCKTCGESFTTYKLRPKVTCSEECHRAWQSVRQSGAGSHFWEGGKTSETMMIRNLQRSNIDH